MYYEKRHAEQNEYTHSGSSRGTKYNEHCFYKLTGKLATKYKVRVRVWVNK